MTFLHASAREWADDHSAAADVRFGRLEAIAFQAHPEIYRWFGVDGAAAAERATRTRPSAPRRVLLRVLVVLAILGIAAPIAAVAVLGGDRFDFYRVDAETSVPVAGVLFGIAAVTQAAVLVLWLARGARWHGLVTGIALVALVFSGLGLFALPNIADYDGFTGWEPWYPVVVVSFAISLGSCVAMFARFRAREPEVLVEVGEAPASGDAVRSAGAAIAALPTAERDAIRSDRDDALRILRTRGLIDEETLERAVGQELGALFLLDGAAAEDG
jgi:hypothetical protein